MPYTNKKSFYQSLSQDEQKYYNEYKENTEGFVYQLNDALRKLTQPPIFSLAIANLDSLISKYEHTSAITLYRACTADLIDPFISGHSYTNPEYLSTATSLESCQRHFTTPANPALMIISCPSNMPMAPMDINENHGVSEDEMLLARNSTFTLESRTELTERAKLEHIMGRFEAEGVTKLVIYKFLYE